MNDKGLLAVANESLTGSTLRAALASRVSEIVGDGPLIGVLVSHVKKSPAWEGVADAGQGALSWCCGEAR